MLRIVPSIGKVLKELKKVGRHPLDCDSKEVIGNLMSFSGMVDTEARIVCVCVCAHGLKGVNGL